MKSAYEYNKEIISRAEPYMSCDAETLTNGEESEKKPILCR